MAPKSANRSASAFETMRQLEQASTSVTVIAMIDMAATVIALRHRSISRANNRQEIERKRASSIATSGHSTVAMVHSTSLLPIRSVAGGSSVRLSRLVSMAPIVLTNSKALGTSYSPPIALIPNNQTNKRHT